MKKGILAGLGLTTVLGMAGPAVASASDPGTPAILAPASVRAWASPFTAFGPLSAPIGNLLRPGLTQASAAAAPDVSESSRPDANGDVYCDNIVAPPVVPHDLIVPPDPTSPYGGNICTATGTQVGHDVIIEAAPSGSADVLDAQNVNVGHDVVVEPAPSGSAGGYLSVDTNVGHDVVAGDNSVVGIGGGNVEHDVRVTNPQEAEVIADSADVPITRAVIGHSFTVTGSALGVVACGANIGQDVVLNNDYGMLIGDSDDQSDYLGEPYGCDAFGGGVQVGHDFVADNNTGGPYVDIADNSPDNPAGAGGIGHDFFALNDTSTTAPGPVVENNAIAKDAVCNPPATTDGPDAPNQVGGKDEGCNAWAPQSP